MKWAGQGGLPVLDLTFFSLLFIQVNQRNVPGIDSAYLAMDTEEGVEVVWNEVQFSERKNFKLQEVSCGGDCPASPAGAGTAMCWLGWDRTAQVCSAGD